jgi:DNA-binding MarR family transcriptional regulator
MDEPLELTKGTKGFLMMEAVTADIERARNLELAKIGLNIPQALVLYCVKTAKEPLTPGKLALMMHRQPHTISALVHRMEARGLVRTRRDLKRKDMVRISLTKKGEEALKKWATTTTVPDAVLSCLSKKEADTLYAITKKLHNKSLQLLRQMQPDPYSGPLHPLLGLVLPCLSLVWYALLQDPDQIQIAQGLVWADGIV